MKKYFSLLSVLAIGILATGCSMGDAYNENANKEASDAAFVKEFGDIASNQTWNTVTQRTATVNVSLGTGESYTVGIYENDPLFNVSNCGLLAQGTVSDGSSVSLKFDSPAEQNHYYVGLFDSKGRSRVQIDSLLNNQMTANFGGSSSSAKSTTRVATRGTASSSYARTLATELGSLTNSVMANYTSITDEDLNELYSKQGTMTISTQMYYWSQEKSNYTKYVADGDGLHYKIAQGTTVSQPLGIQNNGAKDASVLYVEGTLNLTSANKFYGATIVVGSTGVVNINGDALLSGSTSRIIIESGGTLYSNGNYKFEVDNGGGDNYNAGTINMQSGEFNINGGYFYNCGIVNVNKLTGSTNSTTIVNFGKITATVNDNQQGSYNAQYINCCYLKFGDCALGNIIMTDNSRLDVTGLLYMNGTNTLGNQSEINSSSMKLQSAIFNGPTGTGEFAIIKNAGKMYISWYGDGVFNNNIYLDWDKTNCCDYQGAAWDMTNIYQAGYLFVNNIKNWTSEATSSLIIPSGDCTGTGNNSKGGGGDIPTTAPACTFAFEDLGSIGDFDFNDIVLYVYPNTTTKKMDVELVAAGGVLPVTVKFNGTTLFSKTDGQMRNTSSKGSVIATYNDLPFPDDNFTLSSNTYTSMFTIDVKGASSTYTISPNVTAGSTPQALVIAGAWAWPKETVNIGKAYTTFSDWVANPTVTWVTSKVSGQVVE